MQCVAVDVYWTMRPLSWAPCDTMYTTDCISLAKHTEFAVCLSCCSICFVFFVVFLRVGGGGGEPEIYVLSTLNFG